MTAVVALGVLVALALVVRRARRRPVDASAPRSGESVLQLVPRRLTERGDDRW